MKIRRGIVGPPEETEVLSPGKGTFPHGQSPGGGVSKSQRLWPPAGEPVSTRPVRVTVINAGSGPLELLDDLFEFTTEGLPVGGGTERTVRVGAGDELWALAHTEQPVVVVSSIG